MQCSQSPPHPQGFPTISFEALIAFLSGGWHQVVTCRKTVIMQLVRYEWCVCMSRVFAYRVSRVFVYRVVFLADVGENALHARLDGLLHETGSIGDVSMRNGAKRTSRMGSPLIGSSWTTPVSVFCICGLWAQNDHGYRQGVALQEAASCPRRSFS